MLSGVPRPSPRVTALRPTFGTRQVTGERHLRLILSEYADYYNTARPHRALHQRPPAGCPHPPADGADVRVLRRDRLGGLILQYRQDA